MQCSETIFEPQIFKKHPANYLSHFANYATFHITGVPLSGKVMPRHAVVKLINTALFLKNPSGEKNIVMINLMRDQLLR